MFPPASTIDATADASSGVNSADAVIGMKTAKNAANM
jgi:hypothetical protein